MGRARSVERASAPARTGAALACGAVALTALAGCARPVEVEPAPSASEPVCAELLQALPETLGGEEQRSTTSQASRAWGENAITFRCGVTPLPPTTEGCVSVDAADGTAVDWVVVEDDAVSTFTTYGRLPAVEVAVPTDYAGDQSILLDLTDVVAELPRDGARECL